MRTKPTVERSLRDLSLAILLRSRDVLELYGLTEASIKVLINRSSGPPSRFIRGRDGQKGIRLYPRHEFEEWLVKQAI